MLAYDWMWWGQLTNQNLARRCTEVRGGVRRCTEVFQRGGGEKNQYFMLIRFLNAGIWLDVVGTINQSESCAEVRGGVCRGVQRCMEVCGGAQRYADVFQRGGGEKNQDFMLIRFLNAGIWLDVVGTINQSESCTEMHGGVHGGARRCTEVCRGVRGGVRRCAEVHGGMQRCVEVHGGAQRCAEVHRGVSLQLIRFCGEVSLQLFRLCGGVSLQLFKLCGGVSLQLGCVEGCHSN